MNSNPVATLAASAVRLRRALQALRLGAALGALLLTTINSALYVLGISSFWDQAIWGLLLLLAIALDQTITERLTSALRKRRTRHE